MSKPDDSKGRTISRTERPGWVYAGFQQGDHHEKILLLTDGSECALRGVALVISKRAHYANPDDLDIHLVNVQAPFSHDVSRFSDHDQVAAFHHEESVKLMRGHANFWMRPAQSTRATTRSAKSQKRSPTWLKR
ncbi:hypothetical protein LP415_22925 [Polaromonas sp. P1(28)-8]|nr:hypothetical protein LP415_22925 [Polaromonas sp. P1(28)-8]